MKRKIKTNMMVTCLILVSGTLSSQTTPLDPDKDPAIETQTKQFLHALNHSGGKPMETMTPETARGVLEGAQSSVEVDLSGIEIQDRMIEQDGLSVRIYVIRPVNQPEKLPVFMFFHGGGWVLGDFATHKRFVRDLVVNSGAACVFVEYSRSPEVKYPVAINESYAATKWVAENGDQINVDGSRLAIAGNSAGGNITAVIAQMAKDKKGPEIKLQVLFWPVTDFNLETASYNQYADSRFLTKNMMRWFWNHYLEKPEDGESRYASPLKASIEELKDLPPALIQTAENDVLRDEGEAYGRKLDLAGVPVTLTRMQGMIHDYGLLNPLSHISEVQAALRFAGNELRQALK